MPWLARTFWATAICWAGVARGGVRPPAVGEPGLLGELQPAVEAVAGAGGPVTAGLARRDRGPVHPARRRRRGGRRPPVRRRGRQGRRGPAPAAPGVRSAGPAAGPW